MRPAMVLDLDFTLLHLEWREGAIEVPGRTRSAWIALQTAEILRDLSAKFDIVLATARSHEGTQWVVDGLETHGASVSFLVMEDGARLGKPCKLCAFEKNFDLVKWREKLEDWGGDFEWQHDFQNCLVARCENDEGGETLQQKWIRRFEAQEDEIRFFRDGRKVYALPTSANKWSALQKLLGARAQNAAGVGDGTNDLVWLPRVAHPATFARAHPLLVEKIRERGGLICERDGHDGVAQILQSWL